MLAGPLVLLVICNFNMQKPALGKQTVYLAAEACFVQASSVSVLISRMR